MTKYLYLLSAVYDHKTLDPDIHKGVVASLNNVTPMDAEASIEYKQRLHLRYFRDIAQILELRGLISIDRDNPYNKYILKMTYRGIELMETLFEKAEITTLRDNIDPETDII